jgi:hypothetical protein
MPTEHDKVIQFQITEGNKIVVLTESGRLFQKELKTGAKWQKIPVDKWQKPKAQ